jgi:hypothetical protein
VDAVDTRSDIFRFGTILYEMMTSEQAFRAVSAIDKYECRPQASCAGDRGDRAIHGEACAYNSDKLDAGLSWSN